MSRDEYIRDLAYSLLVTGPSLRWETAGEDDRKEAKLLVDKILDSIRIPDEVFAEFPEDSYTAMSAAVVVLRASLSH